jgi:hypothetical protein
MKKSFETGKAPQIIITDCHGSLVIKAHADNHVIVKGDDVLTAEAKADAPDIITISGRASITLLVPEQSTLLVHNSHGSMIIKGVQGHVDVMAAFGEVICKNGHSLHLQQVHGSFIGRDLGGDLTIDQASGDVAARNISSLHVGELHGDLRGRNINGSVHVGQGHGDISLNTVNEAVNIGHVSRDVNLKNIAGLVQVGQVAGDIRLYDSLGSGKHSLQADGDVVVRWPAQSPLILTATAPEVVCKLSLDEEHKAQEGELMILHGRVGDGETHLNITSQQRIIIKPSHSNGDSDFDIDFDFNFDFSQLGAELGQLGARITNEIGQRMATLSTKLESRFGPQYSEDVAHRTEQAVEKVVKKTEEALRRAEEKLARGSAVPSMRVMPVPPMPPAPPAPPRPDPQDAAAAQLKILEMLEKGVISVEEANTLLKAIE